MNAASKIIDAPWEQLCGLNLVGSRTAKLLDLGSDTNSLRSSRKLATCWQRWEVAWFQMINFAKDEANSCNNY